VHLAATRHKRGAYLYDTTGTSGVRSFTGHQAEGVRASVAPGGALLLSWSWDGRDRLWDAWAGRELLRWEGEGGWFNRDGTRLASRPGYQFTLWEVAAGREYRTLPGLRAVNPAGDVSPDGRWLALPTRKGLAVWDLALERATSLKTSRTRAAKFHPSGRE